MNTVPRTYPYYDVYCQCMSYIYIYIYIKYITMLHMDFNEMIENTTGSNEISSYIFSDIGIQDLMQRNTNDPVIPELFFDLQCLL